jgi:hypothetical protein
MNYRAIFNLLYRVQIAVHLLAIRAAKAFIVFGGLTLAFAYLSGRLDHLSSYATPLMYGLATIAGLAILNRLFTALLRRIAAAHQRQQV